MKNLRLGLCQQLGFEDVGLLVKDVTSPLFQESNIFFSISPNVAGEKLLNHDKVDLFFYNPPANSIVMNILSSEKSLLLISNPRGTVAFQEEIDNLSPVVFLLLSW